MMSDRQPERRLRCEARGTPEEEQKTRMAGRVPAADMLRSRPNVGVDAALCKVTEEMEEELSARASGAKGGGLPETGGLKARAWTQHTTTHNNNN